MGRSVGGDTVSRPPAWSPSALVVLVPMLGRSHHVAPLLDSLNETTSGCRVLFLVSPNDLDVHAAIDNAGAERVIVGRRPRGDYGRKINAGYRYTTEALIFTGASDLRFHPGWFEAATAKLVSGIGVVGTNDLGNPLVLAGQHSTHFLVTRSYADTQGTIDGRGAVMAECYPHEYVDVEIIGTARLRGAYAMALDSHVEHLHPHWGKAPTDPTYDAQAHRMAVGKRILQRRMRKWTPS